MPGIAASQRIAAAVLFLVLTTIITITPAVLRSFAEGPFPGYTGGFNEPTCQQCHFGSDLNDPPGALELAAPGVFTPGGAYDITVVLRRPALERGGFQLAARVAGGPSSGADAGKLDISGPALQLVTSDDGKVTYVQHTPEGTRTKTPGALTWSFRWIAPPQPVAVRFDVAANASNDDESPLDDFIYTASKTIVGGRR